MRKILPVIIATSALILSGCESIANVQNISQNGFTNMSCGDISNAFSSYNNDKTTLDSLLAIGGMSTDSFGDNLTDIEIYSHVKDAANLVMVIKGCGTSV